MGVTNSSCGGPKEPTTVLTIVVLAALGLCTVILATVSGRTSVVLIVVALMVLGVLALALKCGLRACYRHSRRITAEESDPTTERHHDGTLVSGNSDNSRLSNELPRRSHSVPTLPSPEDILSSDDLKSFPPGFPYER